jgi:hypothetical protein
MVKKWYKGGGEENKTLSYEGGRELRFSTIAETRLFVEHLNPQSRATFWSRIIRRIRHLSIWVPSGSAAIAGVHH